jgi:hypothetical protein
MVNYSLTPEYASQLFDSFRRFRKRRDHPEVLLTEMDKFLNLVVFVVSGQAAVDVELSELQHMLEIAKARRDEIDGTWTQSQDGSFHTDQELREDFYALNYIVNTFSQVGGVTSADGETL